MESCLTKIFFYLPKFERSSWLILEVTYLHTSCQLREIMCISVYQDYVFQYENYVWKIYLNIII